MMFTSPSISSSSSFLTLSYSSFILFLLLLLIMAHQKQRKKFQSALSWSIPLYILIIIMIRFFFDSFAFVNVDEIVVSNDRWASASFRHFEFGVCVLFVVVYSVRWCHPTGAYESPSQWVWIIRQRITYTRPITHSTNSETKRNKNMPPKYTSTYIIHDIQIYYSAHHSLLTMRENVRIRVRLRTRIK